VGALKVWDGSAWQTVSQQGPAGTAPVTSVDTRTGAVTLADLYVGQSDAFVMSANWTAYTPLFATESETTGAGMTPGAGGYIIGAYRMVAPYTLALRMRLQWGSSGGNGGSNALLFGLPAGYTNAADTWQYLSGWLYHVSTGYMYAGLADLAAGGTVMYPRCTNSQFSSLQRLSTAQNFPSSWYPNGSCGFYGIINVQQRT
jgi:hypothetical protein